jgi:alkylation response protein AidB-like acyl-CoA dehydrogenase
MQTIVYPDSGVVLTDEQRDFAEAIRNFCQRECGTRERRLELTDGGKDTHSPELHAKMAELGWLGVAIPEEYGGSGGSLVDQCVFFEELNRGMLPVSGIGPSSTVAGCYKRFGSEEQKESALGAISEGKVFSISISEPEAGSDVSNVSCKAVNDSNGSYLINGQKTWCTAAHVADKFLVLARTSREEDPHGGLTLIEVPADAEGVEVREIETMAGREVNDIFLTDVVVPAENVVGDLGQGFKQIMAGLDGERLIGAAVGLGMAERALDDALTYIKERKQFGKPIGTFQVLRHRIADLATEIECCRLLTYEVAQRVDEKRGDRSELTRLTSMAKLKSTETAKRAALEGMQMMGGYGYAAEYEMEHHLRVALPTTIYAGTNEIQREIIAGSYGLRG